MQGRVNATQLEFCLSVYGASFKSSLTELVKVQTGHGRHLTRDDDHDPCKSWYSPTLLRVLSI
jgi:hypothetical protein